MRLKLYIASKIRSFLECLLINIIEPHQLGLMASAELTCPQPVRRHRTLLSRGKGTATLVGFLVLGGLVK
jgi:hypothetical protein